MTRQRQDVAGEWCKTSTGRLPARSFVRDPCAACTRAASGNIFPGTHRSVESTGVPLPPMPQKHPYQL